MKFIIKSTILKEEPEILAKIIQFINVMLPDGEGQDHDKLEVDIEDEHEGARVDVCVQVFDEMLCETLLFIRYNVAC